MEERSSEAPLAALRFAEAWAAFTKAVAIYPETNARVQRAFETFTASLAEALDAGGEKQLEVCFHQGAVTFGDEPTGLVKGTPLAWLHDRIHRSSLAGVRFRREVPDSALYAFTRRLLELYAEEKQGRSYDELWTNDYAGLDLIDRRFAGAFADHEGEEGAHQRSWGEASARHVDTQRDDSLLDTLMADPEVSAAVSALQERLRAATMEGEATLEVDLLGRIVRQLPADVMSDPQQIRLVTVTAVRRLAAEMDGIGPAADLADVVAEKGEISRLLFDASQALLGRTGDADNHHPEIQDLLAQDGGSEGNEGARRDRDAAARRDPASILEAIAQLPPPWSEPLDTANVGRLDEQVGVHLHVIANADRTVNQQIEGRAMRGLERLLPHPDASAYAVIQQYLVPAPDERGSGWEERRARVLAAMRRTSLSERLRDAGLVTADDAVASFPRGFGLYLDSLDPADGVDLAELDGVVERIGSKRLHEATEELLGAENVLEPPRTRRVLSARTKTMLPFVRLCLTHGDEDTTRQGMEALRRIYATEEVGCLLSLFGSERTLPSWYVDALADDAFDGVAGEALKRKLGGELVRFVRGAEGNTELRTRRIQAIHDLANFPTSDGNILLTDLVEARRFFVLPREPRAIRLAARKALQAKTHRRRAGRVS